MDRQKAKELREKVTSALKQQVEGELGVTFTVGNIRFSDTTASIKLDAVDVAPDGTKVTVAESDWHAMCGLFGFEKDDLNREFVSQGRTFRISGLKPTNRKYPVIAKCVSTGSSYKFAPETVLVSIYPELEDVLDE